MKSNTASSWLAFSGHHLGCPGPRWRKSGHTGETVQRSYTEVERGPRGSYQRRSSVSSPAMRPVNEQSFALTPYTDCNLVRERTLARAGQSLPTKQLPNFQPLTLWETNGYLSFEAPVFEKIHSIAVDTKTIVHTVLSEYVNWSFWVVLLFCCSSSFNNFFKTVLLTGDVAQ